MPRKVCLIAEKRGSAQNKSDDNGEEGFMARSAPSIKRRMPWADCSPECSDFTFEASDEKGKPFTEKGAENEEFGIVAWGEGKGRTRCWATPHAKFAITPCCVL